MSDVPVDVFLREFSRHPGASHQGSVTRCSIFQCALHAALFEIIKKLLTGMSLSPSLLKATCGHMQVTLSVRSRQRNLGTARGPSTLTPNNY